LNKSKFGLDLRKEVLNAKKKKNEVKDAGMALLIINEFWKEDTFTDKDINKNFYGVVKEQFRNRLSDQNNYQLGCDDLLGFIRNINETRENEGLFVYPEPSLPLVLQRATSTKGPEWLLSGSEISDIAVQAVDYWSKNKTYTVTDILGWTLLSAIFWGGLNDAPALNSFLAMLLDNKNWTIKSFFKEYNIIFLEPEDSAYGYSSDDRTLKRAYNFIPDDITRCWMLKLKKAIIPFGPPPSVAVLLNHVLEKIETSLSYPHNNTNLKLLKYASYHWEQTPEVFIDQAIGRVLNNQQQSCSMPEGAFTLFYNPKINISPLHLDKNKLYTGGFPTDKSGKKASIPHQLAKNITQAIRQILNAEGSPKSKLKDLLDAQVNEPSKRLVDWIYTLAGLTGVRKLKNRTIIRYMDSVGIPWLVITLDEDILEYENIDYMDAYQEILDNKSEKSKDGQRIAQFHQFQVKKYHAPPVDLNIKNGSKRCRSRIISKDVFHAMCDTLKIATGIHNKEREIFLVLIILAYRTGLRHSEIMGLKYGDIERVSGLSFIIRRNLKTGSAYRRIPVGALLKPEELKNLYKYLSDEKKQKKNDANPWVFTLNHDSPLPKNTLYNLVKTLLAQVLGDQPHKYNVHTFRHTALSNLSLILSARAPLIEHLTDYNTEDCCRIRTGLLGGEHNGQDRWFALAHVAGHLNPDYTFQFYLHFAHLMGGYEISQGQVELSINTLLNITGINRQKFDYHHREAFQSTPIILNNIRSLITRELTSKNADWTEYPLSNNFIAKPEPIDLDEVIKTELPGSDNHPATIKMVHDILKSIQDGSAITDVAKFFPIKIELIEQWYKRAILLSNIETQREKPKLFTKDRIENHKGHLLVPLPSRNKKEQALLDKFFINAIELNADIQKPLHTFLNTFLKKTTSSSPEIHFRHDEELLLKEFFQTGEQLITPQNWRLKASTPEVAVNLKHKLMLSRYLSTTKTIFKCFSGYDLSIKDPRGISFNNKSKLKYSTQEQTRSSSLLKYACHMLAIVDLSYSIPTTPQIVWHLSKAIQTKKPRDI
jgi:integrase